MHTSTSGSLHDVVRLLQSSLETWDRANDSVRTRRKDGTVCEFLAITRQVGAGAADVARIVSDRTGWPVFDRELLQAMTDDDESRAAVYARLDERDVGWIEQVLSLLLVGSFKPHDYFPRLVRTILTLARGASAIFIGRGADLILPADHGLRVRLVAPVSQRIAAYGARMKLDPEAARAVVQRIDQERADFVRRHFPSKADDPTRTDLAINMKYFGAKDAAELILDAMNRRGIIE